MIIQSPAPTEKLEIYFEGTAHERGRPIQYLNASTPSRGQWYRSTSSAWIRPLMQTAKLHPYPNGLSLEGEQAV